MRVIPVLDLLDGIVVRGIAGRRDQYQPVESQIAVSATAIDVATAFRQHFGLNTLYVADLDAIMHGQQNHDVLRELRDAGFDLLVDAGVRNPADIDAVIAAGANRAIIGLETWPLFSSLEMLVPRFGDEKLIFSLDLKDGMPVRTFRDLPSQSPLDVAAAVLEAGIRELIVLDIASVGLRRGVSTLSLCSQIHEFAPATSLITGGGIRSVADLKRLRQADISGVLVASALHDGSIQPDDIAES